MVGITRFNITDEVKGKGAWRFEESRRHWNIANTLYRKIFMELGMPLLQGDEVIECTRDEFVAGYDYQLGIDVILRPQGQGENTMQEKFLFTNFDTVTVEHCQDWLNLEPGDWYRLKAQYYFVGYDAERQLRFDPWVLIDWPRLQRATAQHRVPWHLRGNLKNGAKASFLYIKFENLPPEVIVISSNRAYSFF